MEEKTHHKIERIYYSMGEVSEMFDVNPSLIRFWEQKFDILKPHKNKKGNRMFTPEDVENLKIIYHLVKEKGMTLAGAQMRMKQNREGLERDMEVVERLQNIKALLSQIRQELKEDGDESPAVTIIQSANMVEPVLCEPMPIATAEPSLESKPEPKVEFQQEITPEVPLEYAMDEIIEQEYEELESESEDGYEDENSRLEREEPVLPFVQQTLF